MAELAVPLLTVTFGSQLLRLMASTVISVQRERLDVPLAGLGAFGLGVPLLGLLAPLLVRTLGPRRSLWLAAGGTALVRLVVQLVPDALARWLLAPLGVVCFLWFVPVYLSRTPAERWRLGPALMAGISLDTALFGLWGTWDYAWQINFGTITIAAVLAGVQVAALRRVAAAGARGCPPPCVTDPAPTAGAAAAAPLAGLGPALFLFALAWQNIAWQTVFARHSQAPAFALVMLGNAAAIAVAVATCKRSTTGWTLRAIAAVGLMLAALLVGRATTLSLLGGLVAAAVLVTVICLSASVGERRRLPTAPAIAWTLGMEGFFALVFLYYAGYDVFLPYDNQVLLFVAAVVLAIAGVASQRGGPAVKRPPCLPAAFGVVLLAAPLVFAAFPTRGPIPARAGFPVRVMSYNLHFGFDVSGWSDLEGLARAIEGAEPDVVGLQEVNRGWYINGASDMLTWLARRLRMPHVAFGPAADPLWGNAILSRYPITTSAVVPLPREGAPLRRSYLWARIDLGRGQAMQVIDTHLHHLSGAEGERIRLVQVDRLLRAWSGAPATVLMGDFNAQPDSTVISRVQVAGLVDAWRAGGGSQADEPTVPSTEPTTRIDYIWCSPDLRISDFRATTSTASDHRGVMATVSR